MSDLKFYKPKENRPKASLSTFESTLVAEKNVIKLPRKACPWLKKCVKHFDVTDIGRQHYLREKYAALNAEAAKKERKGSKPIKDRFKYFKKMLEDDAFEPAAF